MSTQKEYTKPSVTNYGPVEEITRGGSVTNQDAEGDDNTAYSPGRFE